MSVGDSLLARSSYCHSMVRPFLLFFVLLSLTPLPTKALPLSTNSRWIVDGGGRRVKLACVNWVAHLETMVAEGLSKQPVDAISSQVRQMGFNCVRLTWALYLVTNESLASLTVRQSFRNIGLQEFIPGLQSNNAFILDLTLMQAFQSVVKSLGDKDVMVILDNHITQPMWCCGSSDGNGFFGDPQFDLQLWTKGLTKMATIFKGVPNVVGMSLRNELRGPRQNVNDWYRGMEGGAEAVHAANPDVLVILSGLNFDTDLSFLRNRPVNLAFKGKLVFEVHWYAFTAGQAWQSGNPNQVCAQETGNVMTKAGFLLAKGFPLFVSEFGTDIRGTNVNDNRYLNCFMAVEAELDLDWALWTLGGSYYLREGQKGVAEYFGILNEDWRQSRNQSYSDRIAHIQIPFGGPGISKVDPYKVIFHPMTGLCILRKQQQLELGPCSESEAWTYTPQNTISLKGQNLCLQAEQAGKQAKLGETCTAPNTKWEMISDSKLHISSKVGNDSGVCLDVEFSKNVYVVVTNDCKCLSGDATCDPASQWFKLVDATRSLMAPK